MSVNKSLRMGRVALTVNDLNRVSDWYQSAVGLHLLDKDGESARLGAGDEVLLELRQDKAARQRNPREAGLYHTAFLLPERSDLAAWTLNAIEKRVAVAGASDHNVSEAVYLSDPEGNGVEIYADRPAETWQHVDGKVVMGTEHLDIDDLVKSARGPWQGFTPGSTVGHVHLQVGDIPEAEKFYTGTMALDLTARYPGGSFFSADGYHHHIATNTWHSRGAGQRQFPATGLSEMAIHLSPERVAALKAAGITGANLADPWGTPIAVTLL